MLRRLERIIISSNFTGYARAYHWSVLDISCHVSLTAFIPRLFFFWAVSSGFIDSTAWGLSLLSRFLLDCSTDPARWSVSEMFLARPDSLLPVLQFVPGLGVFVEVDQFIDICLEDSRSHRWGHCGWWTRSSLVWNLLYFGFLQWIQLRLHNDIDETSPNRGNIRFSIFFRWQ